MKSIDFDSETLLGHKITYRGFRRTNGFEELARQPPQVLQEDAPRRTDFPEQVRPIESHLAYDLIYK